jgi:DNA-binding LacI/PurR family transcriptional regulator
MRRTVIRLLERVAQPDLDRQVEVIPPTLVERTSVKSLI